MTQLSKDITDVMKIMWESWESPRYIKSKLWITEYKLRKIYKFLKENGYTEIFSYGWSGCTCKFNESVNWCECGWAPFVWRFTALSKKWIDFITLKV